MPADSIMSDAAWQIIITGVVSVVGLICTMVVTIVGMWIKRAFDQAASASRAATKEAKKLALNNAQVKRTLAESTKEVRETLVSTTALNTASSALAHGKLDAIHVLVNSGMTTQLKIASIALRRLANMPDSTEADKAESASADKRLKEQEEQQAHANGVVAGTATPAV